MNLDRINRDPRMARTPLGHMSVHRYGRWPHEWIGVVVQPRRARGDRRPGVVVGELVPGGCVFDAIYRKRHHEQARVAERHWEDEEATQAALEAADAQHSRDFVERLDELGRRDGVDNLREAVAAVCGVEAP